MENKKELKVVWNDFGIKAQPGFRFCTKCKYIRPEAAFNSDSDQCQRHVPVPLKPKPAINDLKPSNQRTKTKK